MREDTLDVLMGLGLQQAVLGWTVTPFVIQICKNLDDLVKQYESESVKFTIRYAGILLADFVINVSVAKAVER